MTSLALATTIHTPKTVHAKQCMDRTALFTSALSKSFTTLSLDVTEVESSTGGGARTLQHVVLKSESGATLVVGKINFIEKTAELRTLGCVLDISRQRLGVELAIPSREYVAFLDKAERLLTGLEISVKVVAHVPTMPPPSPEEPKRSGLLGRLAGLLAPLALTTGAVSWMVSR